MHIHLEAVWGIHYGTHIRAEKKIVHNPIRQYFYFFLSTLPYYLTIYNKIVAGYPVIQTNPKPPNPHAI